jgi:hypothetical protein
LAVRIASHEALSAPRKIVSQLVVQGNVTFNELTEWIALRRARPSRRSEPLDGHETIHDEFAPCASGETTIEAAYRVMKQEQKKA